MTHILAAAARWLLTAAAIASGLGVVVSAAALIAAVAWWRACVRACRCDKHQPEPPPPLPIRPIAAPEPDTHDDHCGVDEESLATCNAIWKLPTRREETR